MRQFFCVCLVLIVSFIVYFYYVSNNSSKNLSITSPLPDLLTKSFSNVFGSSNIWKPNMGKVTEPPANKPEITASGAISYDLASERLLYQKNVKTKLPMASLSKIITAIIALENESIDKVFTVNKLAAEIGENTMGLSEGEKLPLSELLYGLILHSGNDAAETIAQGSRFGRGNFIYLMNKKAEDLGLSDTHFTNPSGLEGDGNQYSTAYDLMAITAYAIQNREFAKIVSTIDYEIPYTQTHKYMYLINETNLLTSYPGVKGVKTGYTDEAGLCLVTYLEYEGHKIIAVLLNSQSRREEMKELLDYSLKTLGVNPPSHN